MDTSTPESSSQYLHRRRAKNESVPFDQRAGANRRMWALYVWILIVSLAGIQGIFPLYSSLLFRELASVILILVALLNAKSTRRYAVPWGLAYLIVIYTLLTVFRSDYYAFPTQIKLFARLVMFSLPVFVIPCLVRSYSDARNVFLFALFVGGIAALSAPVQEFTGAIPWLYAVENWELDHGRVGFARYLSLLGDPNIGGMLGGLLPLVLLIFRRQKGGTRFRGFVVESLVWSVSLILVAYSLSFTAVLVFSVSIVVTWLTSKRYRARQFAQLAAILLATLVFVPALGDRLIGVVGSFLTPGSSPGGAISDSTYLLTDIGFRLFAYLDINNTPGAVLFGSTYNVVVPSSYFNPTAILAHNGYKEMYLAGGIVALGLYIALFVTTAVKAYRLLRFRHRLPPSIVGTTLAVTITYFVLLIVMWGFPVYQYAGVGVVFWVSVGLILTIYEEVASPNTSERPEAGANTRNGKRNSRLVR